MNRIRGILLINFITMTAFNMAHPITPRLITELGLPEYMFGVFFAGMSIANFVMAPIWGALSDAKGRKQFMLLGVFGYGISQIGFGMSTDPVIIFMFRVLAGGFAVCYVTTALTYMADITTKEERIKYISYYTASGALGSSTGLLLGGYIGRNHYQYTFAAQLAMCLVIVPTIYFIIKEKRKHNKAKIYLEHLKMTKGQIDLNSGIGTMILVIILLAIAVVSYNSTINYYMEAVLNMPTTINGLVMSISGVISLIMNVIVNPYLGKRFDEYVAIQYTMLLAGISIIFMVFIGHPIWSIVLLLTFIATSSLAIPMQQSIVSKLAEEGIGEMLGIQTSARAIGMIIGSLSAGFLFGISSILPFLVSGVCAVIAYGILKQKNIKKKNDDALA